jgi:hypothetical protein
MRATAWYPQEDAMISRPSLDNLAEGWQEHFAIGEYANALIEQVII